MNHDFDEVTVMPKLTHLVFRKLNTASPTLIMS